MANCPPRNANWMLLAAHFKRLANALFSYGSTVLGEQWGMLPFPDGNAAAKWLTSSGLGVSSGPTDDGSGLTPRTRNLGKANCLLLLAYTLRCSFLGSSPSVRVEDEQALRVVDRLFHNMAELMELEHRSILETIATAEEEPDIDTVLGKLAVVEQQLLEAKLERMSHELGLRAKEIDALKQLVRAGAQENELLIASISRIQRESLESIPVHTIAFAGDQEEPSFIKQRGRATADMAVSCQDASVETDENKLDGPAATEELVSLKVQ